MRTFSLMFVPFLIISLCPSPLMVAQTGSTDLVIYTDALQSPWINASWSAGITFNSTEQAYGGSASSIKVAASAWGALSLHYGSWGSQGINPASYQSLVFTAHGGSSGASLSIFFENDAGQSFPGVNTGPLAANQWTAVSIPMSQLNPNGQTISRVSIQSMSSSARTFYVDDMSLIAVPTGTPPPPPTLASPPNGATNQPTELTFTWHASNSATSYTLVVYPEAPGSAFNQSNITDTSYTLSGLAAGTPYAWQVSATNSAGTSDWSATWQFATARPVPAPPALFSPTDGATGISTSPELNWEHSTWAECYHGQVSTDSLFTTIVRENTSMACGRWGQTIWALTGLSHNTAYYWRIAAFNENGRSDWSSVWSFTTEVGPPPPIPILASPADGSTGVSTSPTLRWYSSPRAEAYELHVSDGTTRIVDQRGITDTSYALSGLAANTTYFWEVMAYNANGADRPSSPWRFTTVGPPPAAPVLVSPANFATGLSTSPTLSWRTSTGASSYRLQVSTTSDFSTLAKDQIDIADTSFTINGLSEGTRYFWRVSASNSGGASEWSGVWSFYTTPPTPTLASPSNGSVDVSTSPSLSWNESSGAFHYTLQVSKDAGFSQLVVNLNSITIPSFQVSGLSYTSTYYWRVNASFGSGTSSWSDAWSFTTIPSSQSGWTVQSSGTTASLRAVTFVGANTGIVVGEGGTILRTTDGGVTWTTQTSGTTANLAAVSFTDDNTGTAVGSGSTILRTTDGGSTWTSQSSGFNSNFTGVSFVDANTGTIVAEFGQVFRTTDGGASWTFQGRFPFGASGVQFTSVNSGYALASVSGAGHGGSYVARTTDAGSTWTGQNAGTRLGLSGISFVNDNAGMVVGMDESRPLLSPHYSHAVVWRTTDAGGTWTWALAPFYRYNLSAVSLADVNNAAVVGQAGTVLRTTDGGASWTGQSTGTSAWLRGVALTGSNTGVVVGDDGLIMRTTTGGNPPAPPSAADLVVYDDVLQSPWINASWSATVTFGSTEQAHSGSNSIKVVASAWGALSLHHGNWGSQGIDPAPYQSLDFAVYATNASTFYISLGNDQGQSFPTVSKTISPNSWVAVSIPMSQLNPNSQTIHRISLQKSTSGTFYVDELRFVGAAQAPATLADMTTDALEGRIPTEFGLSQNYPNPFNPTTVISYELPVDSWVTLKIYNLLGQEVTTLANGVVKAGRHQVRWDASGLPSSIYVYRLTVGNFVATKRMLLLK